MKRITDSEHYFVTASCQQPPSPSALYLHRNRRCAVSYDQRLLFNRITLTLRSNPCCSLTRLSRELGVSRRTIQNAVNAVTGRKFRDLREDLLLAKIKKHPATSKPLAQAYGFTGGPGVAPVPNGNYEINLKNRGGVETNRELAVAAGYVLAPFHDGIQEVGSSVPVPGGLGYANPQEEWGSLRANLSRGPGRGTPYYLHGKGLYFTEGHAYTAGCVCDPYLDVLKAILFKLDPSGVGEGDENGRIAAAVEKAPN